MSTERNNLPLTVRFEEAQNSLTKLDSLPYRRDSADFQKELTNTLSQLQNIKQTISQLSLFSINESIDEVDTRYLKYLSVDLYVAKALENNSNPKTGLKGRLENLRIVNSLYLQFLYGLENYGILNKQQSKILDNFENSYNPTLDEVRVADPTRRRADKIENFKMEKELNNRIQIMESGEFDNLDDEDVRKVYLDQLRLFSLKAFQNLESNLMEVELLGNMPNMPSTRIGEVGEGEEDSDDKREKPKLFDEGYTDRLESLTNPVISKQGKVLRPFTIVSSQRDKLQQKVFGTGQVLPTMTVEELVDYELANGGMVKDELPEKEFDEDDEVDVDRLTYQKRDWDLFTESNVKGSGNTQNLG